MIADVIFILENDDTTQNSHTATQPYNTADFPVSRCQRRRTKRVLHEDATCTICLESKADTVLPKCGHTFHAACLFAVVPQGVAGAGSMQRCPVCRETITNECIPDIIGYKVTPKMMAMVAERINLLRSIFTPNYKKTRHSPHVAISKLRRVSREDGFIYNTSILCIERAIEKRKMMTPFIIFALRTKANDIHCKVDFITRHVASHIDFLIKTHNA